MEMGMDETGEGPHTVGLNCLPGECIMRSIGWPTDGSGGPFLAILEFPHGPPPILISAVFNATPLRLVVVSDQDRDESRVLGFTE
jgi:hypothetical protein